jgi:hypothetical protein
VNSSCPVSAHNGQVCWFNLNNYDLDPIRRPCAPAIVGSVAPTNCTDMTTGLFCQASDNNANCTQGLVTALTDTDPEAADITDSIAARIANDNTGKTIGYAGLEAVSTGRATKGEFINTISYQAQNVRPATFMMARRLFLQNALTNSTSAADISTDTAGPAISTAGAGELGIGGGSAQVTAEQNFWNWATLHENIDPIVTRYNFITCGTDPATEDACTASNNLCTTTAGPVASALGAYIPNGAAGGSNGTGGAKYINSSGSGISCTAGSTCVTGPCCTAAGPVTGTTTSAPSHEGTLTYGTCTGALTCPVANLRPSNAACTLGTDCASGVCTDNLFFGESPASLICQ